MELATVITLGLLVSFAHGSIRCGNTTCNSDECCVNVPTVHCKKLETKFQFCSVVDDRTGSGHHAHFCPCEKGLECNPLKTFCQEPSVVAAARKEAALEAKRQVKLPFGKKCGKEICGPSECCVNVPNKHCAKLGEKLDLCGPIDDLSGSGNYPLFCPCKVGLQCDWTDILCKEPPLPDNCDGDGCEKKPKPKKSKKEKYRKNRCPYWWC